jgi:uracil-DNA glycosylase
VHASGIPWDDPSGVRLRQWLGVSDEIFYDEKQFGILPMGFCYPGTGKSGDLPPRPECAPQWHDAVLSNQPQVRLKILIGKYAQDYYLREAKKTTLTEKVLNFEKFLPAYFPLPHPSPRNIAWFKKNPWFEETALPILKSYVNQALHA